MICRPSARREGLADWWLHRSSDIEHTAGTRESVFHSLLLTEAGLPILLGLFCQPDPVCSLRGRRLNRLRHRGFVDCFGHVC